MTSPSQTQTENSPVSFARGAPSTEIVDVEGLSEAARTAFAEDPAGTTGYGTAIGYVPLRRWIAEKHGVPENHVLVTNGSMQADAFFFDELISPGDVVVTERPTYDRTLLGLRQRGADVRLVTLEEDGVAVDEVASLLTDGVRPGSRTSSRTSRTRPGTRCRWTSATGCWSWPGSTTSCCSKTTRTTTSGSAANRSRMLELDGGPDSERVVYASSFSKTVCPGIRVGYLVGPPALIDRIKVRATNTYISPNMVAESIVNSYVRGNRFPDALQTIKTALAERVDKVGQALSEHLPEAHFVQPDGGYFLWVTLPEGKGHDGRRIAEEASNRGVTIVPGSDFLLDGGENSFRLAYSAVLPDTVDSGIRRLAEAVHAARG